MTLARDRPRAADSLLLRGLFVVAVLIAVYGVASAWALWTNLNGQARADAARQACAELTLLAGVRQDGLSAGLADRIRQQGHLADRYDVYRDPSGVVSAPGDEGKVGFIASTVAHPDRRCPPPASAALAAYLDRYFEPPATGMGRSGGRDYAVERLALKADRGVTQLAVAVAVARPPAILLLVQALAVLALVAVVGAVGLRAHARYRRRIEALNLVFDRLQGGEITARPAESDPDEIGRLGQNISRSLDRIQNLVEAVERVTLEVAHELKRPLTNLVNDVWSAKDSTGDERTREELAAIYRRMLQFRSILDELLSLGRRSGLGGGEGDGFDVLDLSALTGEICANARPGAEAKGLRLKARISTGIEVRGSSTMLGMLIGNLLDNALKYTPSGEVNVQLGQEEGEFRLSVRDTGPGIPAEAAARLLTPFYRATTDGDVDGHGLGLTLALNIAIRHGFTLDHRNRDPGLEVILTGPVGGGPPPDR